MRTVLKTLLVIVVAAIAARLASLTVSRQLDEGSEVSDEVSRTVVMNGLDFRSRARGLRSGQVRVLLGGARLDLREATLDPGGARFAIENTLGGVLLVVPASWAVTVDEEIIGGGEAKVDVTALDDLPEDAPRLTVELVTRFAGSVVSTEGVGV